MNGGSSRPNRLPAAGDIALTLALAVAAFSAVSPPDAGLYALAAVGIFPLALRRRFPIAVLAVVTAVTTIVAVDQDSWWPFAAFIALYSVGAHCTRRTAIIAGAASILVLVAGVASDVDWTPLGWNDIALMGGRLAPLAAAWILGDNIRTRGAYLRAVEDRASQLEREQEAKARQAAAEEQTRIAREVHDVVAHNLSVIVVQATAADAVFNSDPTDARRAIRAIGTTARQALDELRRVLGVIRIEEGRLPDFSPQPRLSRLEGLIEQVRAAGLEVDLEVGGNRRELPPALELSAFRIVQEALTNTLRHAGASHARVTLRFETDALDVEVVDDGTPSTGENGGGGRGVIGMRERAAAFGGHVEAGPDPAGGFRVAARLPVDGQ
jgi:signal transduction histidine kinase